MTIRGDQEPALRTMMDRMKMLCGDQCTLDKTPVVDSQSTGSVESTPSKCRDNSELCEELWNQGTERK